MSPVATDVKGNRRVGRLSISIWTLGLITTTLAVFMGWWADHQHQNATLKRQDDRIRELEAQRDILKSTLEESGYTVIVNDRK